MCFWSALVCNEAIFIFIIFFRTLELIRSGFLKYFRIVFLSKLFESVLICCYIRITSIYYIINFFALLLSILIIRITWIMSSIEFFNCIALIKVSCTPGHDHLPCNNLFEIFRFQQTLRWNIFDLSFVLIFYKILLKSDYYYEL